MKLNIDTAWLTLLVGTLIPLVVAVVTKKATSSRVKAWVNLILTAVSAIGIRALGNDGVLDQGTLVEGFAIFITGIATYYGFHKPTNVSGTIADNTSAVGI